MWFEFFKFDLRYQLRQWMLWITTLPLMIISFIGAGSDGARIGGAIGNIHLNSPVVIANQLGILSIVAMFLVTVFIAGTVLRDQEVGIADLLFATPMRKIDYLLGRFLAGFVVCILIFALIVLAMLIGSRMSYIDPERLSAFSLEPYLWSFFVFILPNLLFVSAFLMLLAATTRSLILVYVGVLGFMVLWAVAGALRSFPGAENLAVMLDPFGVRALAEMSKYFTSEESNNVVPGFSGILLFNRVLWSCISLGLFAATVYLFKPQRLGTGSAWFGARWLAKARKEDAVIAPKVLPRFTPRFNLVDAWAQCWSELRFDTKGVLKSIPFLVMLLLALANFVANYMIGGARLDSMPYPLTRLMLEELAGAINFVLGIVLLFYSGELIFKERQAKIADLRNAMPVPNWVPLVAKSGALIAVVFSFLFAGVILAIVIQCLRGGAPIEFGLYVQGTALNAVYFILLGLAMLALQVLANNKYVGYVLGLGLMMLSSALSSFDINLRLVDFASLPPLEYSDLNGYGHFLKGWLWFAVYWSLFTLSLLFIAQAFWVRTSSQNWRARLASGLRAVFSLRGGIGLGLSASLIAFAATGGWILYNTTVLNRYEAKNVELDRLADYEKKFRQYLAAAHPSITGVKANVDIFPKERRVVIEAQYLMQNKGQKEVELLQLQTDLDAETSFQNLPAHQVVVDDKRHGYKVLKLSQPLQPGASLALQFKVNVVRRGFTNSGGSDPIRDNGTLFAFENFFPRIGYDQSAEIADKAARRQRGLGDAAGMPKLEDQQAKNYMFWKLWGFDADLMDFETTVSTSADQIAIAPGDLQQSWEKNGRRYFHYKMDKPIAPFFSYQSGKWEVKKADWKGVPIEIYYDKKHPYNIDSMVSGAQAGLDYLSTNFGAYPHKQLRILEIPLYQTYARSFPNTIPFSESLGFINDLRDKTLVDHVFYITAHEIAHQWWGDQAIAANVQGSGMVTETLAEYSALMALEKQFGAEKTRHILRSDLKQYLSGRGKELKEEQALFKNEGQVYLQYRKGSLIMYRLREEIGEAAVNRALGKFINAYRYQTRPYPTSLDVLRFIREETPADKQELITDMFERIVLYDNRILDASAKQRADGQWDVTMKLQLQKLQANSKGKETIRTYDEAIDVAIFSRKEGAPEREERILLREKYMLPSGESILSFTVKDKPYELGIDPYHLLIDRKTDDNRKLVRF